MGVVGRGSQREGLYVYRPLIDIVVQQKPTKYCKTAVLKLKNCSPGPIREGQRETYSPVSPTQVSMMDFTGRL